MADIVKLELKRGMGEPFYVELHKGRAAYPLGNIAPYQHELPAYVRSLTDPYKVEFKYWEIFECFRKVTLVGALIFFGQGSLEQLLVGMIICALSLALYNNLKPYDTWQNNVLQQVCQFNIFMLFLSGLVLRVMKSESPGTGFQRTTIFIGVLLSAITLTTTLLTIPSTLLDYFPDPVAQLKLWRRVLHRACKGIVRHLCYSAEPGSPAVVRADVAPEASKRAPPPDAAPAGAIPPSAASEAAPIDTPTKRWRRAALKLVLPTMATPNRQPCASAQVAAPADAGTGTPQVPFSSSTEASSCASSNVRQRLRRVFTVARSASRMLQITAGHDHTLHASNEVDEQLRSEGYLDSTEFNKPVEEEEEEVEDEAAEIKLQRELNGLAEYARALEAENASFKEHSRSLETRAASEWVDSLRGRCMQGQPLVRPMGSARLQLSERARRYLPPIIHEERGGKDTTAASIPAAAHSGNLASSTVRMARVQLQTIPAVRLALCGGGRHLGVGAPTRLGGSVEPVLELGVPQLSTTLCSARRARDTAARESSLPSASGAPRAAQRPPRFIRERIRPWLFPRPEGGEQSVRVAPEPERPTARSERPNPPGAIQGVVSSTAATNTQRFFRARIRTTGVTVSPPPGVASIEAEPVLSPHTPPSAGLRAKPTCTPPSPQVPAMPSLTQPSLPPRATATSVDQPVGPRSPPRLLGERVQLRPSASVGSLPNTSCDVRQTDPEPATLHSPGDVPRLNADGSTDKRGHIVQAGTPTRSVVAASPQSALPTASAPALALASLYASPVQRRSPQLAPAPTPAPTQAPVAMPRVLSSVLLDRSAPSSAESGQHRPAPVMQERGNLLLHSRPQLPRSRSLPPFLNAPCGGTTTRRGVHAAGGAAIAATAAAAKPAEGQPAMQAMPPPRVMRDASRIVTAHLQCRPPPQIEPIPATPVSTSSGSASPEGHRRPPALRPHGAHFHTERIRLSPNPPSPSWQTPAPSARTSAPPPPPATMPPPRPPRFHTERIRLCGAPSSAPQSPNQGNAQFPQSPNQGNAQFPTSPQTPPLPSSAGVSPAHSTPREPAQPRFHTERIRLPQSLADSLISTEDVPNPAALTGPSTAPPPEQSSAGPLRSGSGDRPPIAPRFHSERIRLRTPPTSPAPRPAASAAARAGRVRDSR